MATGPTVQTHCEGPVNDFRQAGVGCTVALQVQVISQASLYYAAEFMKWPDCSMGSCRGSGAAETSAGSMPGTWRSRAGTRSSRASRRGAARGRGRCRSQARRRRGCGRSRSVGRAVRAGADHAATGDDGRGPSVPLRLHPGSGARPACPDAPLPPPSARPAAASRPRRPRLGTGVQVQLSRFLPGALGQARRPTGLRPMLQTRQTSSIAARHRIAQRLALQARRPPASDRVIPSSALATASARAAAPGLAGRRARQTPGPCSRICRRQLRPDRQRHLLPLSAAGEADHSTATPDDHITARSSMCRHYSMTWTRALNQSARTIFEILSDAYEVRID